MKAALKRARFPLRRSKYSDHVYDDQQHVILLVLRQYFGMSYREFCDLMEVCTLLLEELGLDKVPHWTTLQKFSLRTDMRRLERLLLAFLEEVDVQELHLAVDSSGFGSTSASRYYIRTMDLRGNGMKRRSVKRFVKQTMVVDTDKQLILALGFAWVRRVTRRTW